MEWRAEHFDATVIARTLAPLYVESTNSTHPFVARMQPVNPVDLVERVLREAEKQIASPASPRTQLASEPNEPQEGDHAGDQ